MGIILILFAVSFIIVGVVYSNNHETKLNNCTEQVTAKVTENREDTKKELTSNYEYELTKVRYKKVEVYTSVFEYKYDGRNYRAEDSKSKYSASFKSL